MATIVTRCPNCHGTANYNPYKGATHCPVCGYRAWEPAIMTPVPPESAADNQRTIARIRRSLIRRGR